MFFPRLHGFLMCSPVSTQKHAGRSTGYIQLPLGVNESVRKALPWTGAPSWMYSHIAPVDFIYYLILFMSYIYGLH